jgi:hypothetical protein
MKLSHRRPELRSVLHAAGQLLATAGQQAIEENETDDKNPAGGIAKNPSWTAGQRDLRRHQG